MVPTISVPNEVLDLKTLLFVEAAVKRAPGLIDREWSDYKKLFGFPVGIERCAVGHAVGSLPWRDHAEELSAAMERYDLDCRTLAAIAQANDSATNCTPEERREAMLVWFERAIAYATNVKREIEKLASSSSSNVATELVAA